MKPDFVNGLLTPRRPRLASLRSNSVQKVSASDAPIPQHLAPAEKPDLPCPAAFGDRDRMLDLGNIERHKSFAILAHGPPSVMRLGSVRPSNPRSL
jgi:hypothetical protein